MNNIKWLKQTSEPLFPKVLWNQPVNKRAAGSLLIIGGHKSRFSTTQSAYAAALNAGIGSVKVALPNSVQKLTGTLPDCVFVPSTQSGSIAREALEELLAMGKMGDGVLLSGELSNNSETVGMLEQLLREITAPIMITSEVMESLLHVPDVFFGKDKTLIAPALTFSGLAKALRIPIYVKKPNLLKEIELLQALEDKKPGNYVLFDDKKVIVQGSGKTSVTGTKVTNQGELYGTCATWWLQHPKPFEALTTAAFQLSESSLDH